MKISQLIFLGAVSVQGGIIHVYDDEYYTGTCLQHYSGGVSLESDGSYPTLQMFEGISGLSLAEEDFDLQCSELVGDDGMPLVDLTLLAQSTEDCFSGKPRYYRKIRNGGAKGGKNRTRAHGPSDGGKNRTRAHGPCNPRAKLQMQVFVPSMSSLLMKDR